MRRNRHIIFPNIRPTELNLYEGECDFQTHSQRGLVEEKHIHGTWRNESVGRTLDDNAIVMLMGMSGEWPLGMRIIDD
jgi:hypothetical protein